MVFPAIWSIFRHGYWLYGLLIYVFSAYMDNFSRDICGPYIRNLVYSENHQECATVLTGPNLKSPEGASMQTVLKNLAFKIATWHPWSKNSHVLSIKHHFPGKMFFVSGIEVVRSSKLLCVAKFWGSRLLTRRPRHSRLGTTLNPRILQRRVQERTL